LLWLYQRVFFGTVTNPKNEKLTDLTPREVFTFVPLMIMALWIGLYPKPFFQILEPPVKNLVDNIQMNSQAPAVAAQPAAAPSFAGVAKGGNETVGTGTSQAGEPNASGHDFSRADKPPHTVIPSGSSREESAVRPKAGAPSSAAKGGTVAGR